MAIPQTHLPSCLTRLPYALPYLQEAFSSQIPETASWPTRWAVDQDQLPRDVQTSSALCDVDLRHGDTEITLHTDPLRVAPFYWEMTILGTRRKLTKSSKLRGRIEVGFGYTGRGGVRVTYNSNGDMAFGRNLTTDKTDEPYGPEDTIGCGYVAPGCFIFTKNGEVKDRLLIQAWGMLPYARVSLKAHRDTDIGIKVNFGQAPFVFNFGEYFRLKETPRIVRMQELAWRLPVEIFEDILEHCLCRVNVDLDSEYPDVFDTARRALGSLALVCRRWNTLCSRRIFGTMQLTGATDIQRVWRFHHISTRERPDDTWLHHLLLSTPPRSLVTPRGWTCTSSLPVTFMGRLPSRISSAFYSLPRRAHFAHVRKVVLEHLRFSSWIRFAKFVFAFPQLDELHLDDVTWDTGTELNAPPTWLRSFHKIGRVCLGTNNRSASQQYGVLLLLISHTRERATTANVSSSVHHHSLTLEDRAAITQIVKLLCSWCSFDQVSYKALNKTQCTISCTYSGLVVLTLQLDKPVPTAPNHRLTNVGTMLNLKGTELGEGCYYRFILQLLPQYRKVLSRLSNANDQACQLRLFKNNAGRFCIEARWYPVNDDRRGTITCNLKPPPPMKLLKPAHLPKSGEFWIKLFEYVDQDYGEYITNISSEESQGSDAGYLDLAMPELPAGWYFLAVGDYSCRTAKFEVVA